MVPKTVIFPQLKAMKTIPTDYRLVCLITEYSLGCVLGDIVVVIHMDEAFISPLLPSISHLLNAGMYDR